MLYITGVKVKTSASGNNRKRCLGGKPQKAGDRSSCVLGAELEHAKILRRSLRKELDYSRCMLRIHKQEFLVIDLRELGRPSVQIVPILNPFVRPECAVLHVPPDGSQPIEWISQ